jgi:hypothetical protein
MPWLAYRKGRGCSQRTASLSRILGRGAALAGRYRSPGAHRANCVFYIFRHNLARYTTRISVATISLRRLEWSAVVRSKLDGEA